MARARFPLVGSLTNRNVNAALADAKDQQFVNCFPEVTKNTITGKGEVTLNKRQGTAASSDVASGATAQYGAVVWTTNSAAVAPAIFSYLKTGGSDMMFFNTAGTQIGSDISTTNSCLSMSETDISGTGNLTAIMGDDVSNANEAWFFPEGGAWTQITDAQFPASITPSHCHMDGYMFVMTEGGALWNSDLNSLANWTAGSFITANSFGDNGVGCERYRNMIVGFGDGSAEFFFNAGNATGSVLNRIDNATLRIGAVRNTTGRGTAIRSLLNTVYWIGNNSETGSRGIYRLNGMQAEKISNPAIDKLVSNGVIRSIAGSFSLLGMSHVAFAGSTSVWCYCVEQNFWWLLTPGGSLTIAAMLGTVDSSSFSKSYFSAVTNAKVYSFDPNSPVWQDNSTAYTMTVQTDNMTLGTNKVKFWNALHLDCDVQGSASDVSVSWSDDDGATYSTARTIDTSTAQVWITELGSSRRRIWKFAHAANTGQRIKAVEIDYTLGAM